MRNPLRLSLATVGAPTDVDEQPYFCICLHRNPTLQFGYSSANFQMILFCLATERASRSEGYVTIHVHERAIQ